MNLQTDEYGFLKNLNLFHTYDKIDKDLAFKWWPDLDIAVFDIETTSLDYNKLNKFRIVQFAIGIHKMPSKEGGTNCKEFHNFFINPGIPIEEEAMSVHNLYHSDYDSKEKYEQHGSYDLKGHKPWFEIQDEVENIMNKADLWCAYNHSFDVCGYNSERIRCGLDTHLKPTIDPLVWLRKQGNGRNLWQAARRFGVASVSDIDQNENKQLHDARTDIELLSQILWAMQPELPPIVWSFLYRQCVFMKDNQEDLKEKYG